MRNLQQIKAQLKALSNKERALISQRFFKTGPGEYAEGDCFHGIKVPEIRKLAKACHQLSLTETKSFLESKFHEERLLALFILIHQFQTGNESQRKTIYTLYCKSNQVINNWDLVDASAQHIVGAYLEQRDKAPLHKMAKSRNLWQRRIAIMSTFGYIKQGRFTDALNIAELLLNDKEDLIHKAVGWMLREIGKRDLSAEEGFLKRHAAHMPRTMLRYAIEKFPEKKRKIYMKYRAYQV
jgi:3-methyladenine DNA glycosylase AlkD